MKIIADRNWWMTLDGNRVEDRHPLAARLIVGKGSEIEEEELMRYPLLDAESESKAISEPPQTKAVKAPKRR
jgi:hypothetical protein